MSTIPGALLRQGADKETMKTKTTAKRGTRARKPIVCCHVSLYACVSERHDDRYATFIMCTKCAHAVVVDDVRFRRPVDDLWLSTCDVAATPENKGARITILAGPSSDFTALSFACIDECERRQMRALDIFYSEMAPLLLKTESAELLAKLTAKRESLKRSHYSDIAKRFEVARDKIRAAA